uniref:Protein kinase domain-containing protein n=1 Tax=Lotharella oceanica TaxID=641309 RepID=A0A7S2TJE8_9EUKA
MKAVAPLRHRNVLKLIQVLDSPKLDTVYVILEYAEKGQIMEWNSKKKKYVSQVLGQSPLGGIEIRHIGEVLRGVVTGLQYMHSKLVTHGDIKPDNLLLGADLTVKLSDFGSTRSHKDANPPAADGTYPFWSPEMAGSCPEKSDAFSDDTWAMSVTLYCMAFGDPPFYELNPMELFKLITTQQIAVPAHAEKKRHTAAPVVKEIYDLITGALALDKSKRLSLQKVAAHPFLQRAENTNAAAAPENTTNGDERKAIS